MSIAPLTWSPKGRMRCSASTLLGWQEWQSAPALPSGSVRRWQAPQRLGLPLVSYQLGVL